MTTMPTTKYAKSGDVHIAYQVVGDGAQNLVLVPGWVSHIEYAWEDPSPGPDHFPFVGDTDAILDAVEEFLTGAAAGLAAARLRST